MGRKGDSIHVISLIKNIYIFGVNIAVSCRYSVCLSLCTTNTVLFQEMLTANTVKVDWQHYKTLNNFVIRSVLSRRIKTVLYKKCLLCGILPCFVLNNVYLSCQILTLFLIFFFFFSGIYAQPHQDFTFNLRLR